MKPIHNHKAAVNSKRETKRHVLKRNFITISAAPRLKNMKHYVWRIVFFNNYHFWLETGTAAQHLPARSKNHDQILF